KNVLNSKEELTEIYRPSLPEYAIFSPTEISNHWARFKKIIFRYRFFKDSTGKNVYDTDYRRFSDGVHDLNTLIWPLEKIFSFYGEIPNGKSEKELTLNQLKIIFNDF